MLRAAVTFVALRITTRAVPRSPISPAGAAGRAVITTARTGVAGRAVVAAPAAVIAGLAVVTTAPTRVAGRAVVAAPAAGITERTIVTTAVVPARPVIIAAGVATAVLLVPTHANVTCSVFCLPRAQSRAAMGFLPLGCTRVSSTA